MKKAKELLIGFQAILLILSVSAGCSNATENADDPADISATIETPTAKEATEFPELKIETISDGERIYDKMNYVFVPDDEVLGQWDAVSIVENIDGFDPVTQTMASSLFWQSVVFFENGEAELQIADSGVTQKWTRGYLFFKEDEVISSYTVKQLGGTHYLFAEWKSGDYTLHGQKPWYYVFKKATDPELPKDVSYTIQPYDDVRTIANRDRVGNLSLLDLTDFGENTLTLQFNEKTIFPPRDKLPKLDTLQPEYVLEAGKNPGLGVRSLHEEGITGKGVTVAIIDQPLFIDSHPEYKGKIIEYKDFDCHSETSMHGPAVASLLVGETTGTAPGAKVYYAAAPSWTGDATYFADALDWIVETNEKLSDDQKIRLVSLSAAPTPSDPRFKNGEKYLESFKRAQEAGILVLDSSTENAFIGSCAYDFNNPEDVALCQPVDVSQLYPHHINPDILAPVNYRTMAEEYVKGDCSYQYTGRGGWSWAIPYAAGVLAMGWEVKPELTANEIVQILLDTAYVDGKGNKYIDPIAFVGKLQNN